jgi:cystathionine gamma-synthase
MMLQRSSRRLLHITSSKIALNNNSRLVFLHHVVNRQLNSSSGKGGGDELSPAEAGRLGYQLRKNLDKNSWNESSLSLSTLLSHAGLSSSSNENNNAPLSPPIELATTYERPADGNYGEGGLIYSRSCNPTRKLLETAIGKLEAGHGQTAPTFAFSSGMAAVASLLLAQKSPVKVLLPEDVYHGVPTQLHVCLNDHGILHESVNMTNVHDIRQTIEHHLESKHNIADDGTLVVWMETPSNPLCQVTDIQSICEFVNDMRSQKQNSNIITVVDSTWAPPVITRPLLLGADSVIHSGTKYLGGHSDVLLGTISCSPNKTGKSIAQRLKSVQTSIGAVASPLECWLTLRGLRSLHVRVERQCQTAMKLATYLDGHEHIVQVHYPGLESHPHHATAKHQMTMYGGMLSFEVKSESMAMAVAGAVNTIRRATSLGGTETLIEHRASIEPPERRTSPPGLLRMSVGLEDADDLIHDLKAALDIASQICHK